MQNVPTSQQVAYSSELNQGKIPYFFLNQITIIFPELHKMVVFPFCGC